MCDTSYLRHVVYWPGLVPGLVEDCSAHSVTAAASAVFSWKHCCCFFFSSITWFPFPYLPRCNTFSKVFLLLFLCRPPFLLLPASPSSNTTSQLHKGWREERKDPWLYPLFLFLFCSCCCCLSFPPFRWRNLLLGVRPRKFLLSLY